jgi:hypothetical protein
MNKYDFEYKYKEWWLGKLVRPIGSDSEFRRVVDIALYGPPSFFYGSVVLHFEDGSEHLIHPGNAFKPRKKDIEIKVEK